MMAFYAQSPLLAELRAVECMFTSERAGHARADSRLLSACSRARSEVSGSASVSVSGSGSGKESVSEESDEELEELDHSEPELELDCPVCLDLLYKPMAYGCGHTVCKPCHKRTVANTGGGDERCPVCRHAGQQVVKLRVMRRLIRDQHPQEARARRAQEAKTRAKEAEERCNAAREARVPPGVYRWVHSCTRICSRRCVRRRWSARAPPTLLTPTPIPIPALVADLRWLTACSPS